MIRNVKKQLAEWKNQERRKPLIIRGARQVGKTWSIKDFGAEYFDDIIVIDFEKQSSYRSFFQENIDPQTIIQSIEITVKKKIIPGRTLLFFDEIQNCPRAIMSLRYFYEEIPELHVIAAGSLLDFVLESISFPVGRVQSLTMYPMTFAEFLQASDNKTAVDIVLSKPEKLPLPVHNALLAELKTYFLTGGMPESVKRYMETHSFIDSFKVQKELAGSFMDDFRKYALHVNFQCLEDVFRASSKNIGNQINYSKLSGDFTHPTVKKAFDILLKAGIIHKVSSVGKIEIPFDIQSSSRKFKAVMFDTGIWQQLSGISYENESDLMDIYRGALAEQFVGQELAVSTGSTLFYWAREAKSSSAEVDYLVNLKGRLFPVEVKSSSSGSLKSLHLALSSYPECSAGLVFSTRNYAEIPDQRLIFLPLYYAGSLSYL